MNMDISSHAAGLFQQLIKSVYPPRCVLCGCGGFNQRDICQQCYQALPWVRSACRQCALPLPDDSGYDMLCGNCLKKPPRFDHSLSLFSYEADAVALVHQLKFNEKLAIARLLGELLVDLISVRHIELPDFIVPVPLYRKRLRQRGFNQSIEIARPVARKFGIELDVKSAVRLRDTTSQTGLDRKQRRKNIRGAFDCVQPLNAQHVAIVDDVVTTTSTVNELARVLKRAGAVRVDVWSVARAL